MITVRFLEETDYPMLCQWWQANRFPPPPKDFLPGNGTEGILVFHKETPVCAGFVYETNSKVAWIEFIVANFDVKDRNVRNMCLDFMIKQLILFCKKMDKKYIYSTLKSKSLIDKYEANGFMKGSDGVQEMVMVLSE